MMTCVYFFLLWYFSSHYPRYLMPIFPLMAVLAAEQLCHLFSVLTTALRRWLKPQEQKILKVLL
jgi:hypothetical protein